MSNTRRAKQVRRLNEKGAASLRRLLLQVFQVVLRAGMTLAVIAQIGAGRRIVGLVALRAVGRGVAAAIGDHGHCRFIIVAVAVIVGVVVIPAAVIGVRAEAADRSAAREPGPKAAAVTMMPVTTTPIAATTLPVARSRDAACTAVGRREGLSAPAAYEAATAGTYRCAGGEIATAAADPRAAEIAAAHVGAATAKV